MNLRTHERIVQEALSGRVGLQELKWIVRANLRCDLYLLSPERHFDNAPDRESLAILWEKGLNHYYSRALDWSRRSSGLTRKYLEPFGEASHALADFYAHTNWVELQVENGDPEALAPLLESSFDIHKFPSGIQSGYYSLHYGPTGCPRKDGVFQAPPPFRFCHETLAKDHAEKGHGGERVSPGGPSFYELAVSLAIRATSALWDRFSLEREI
ncbi:MAG TPA: hypothetical protein VMT46_15060 [Anaerolineaceae bacterium]|nr:hypothetical protein [Anaerolineaceae bacterium]